MNGNNGLLVPKEQPEALAEALLEMAENRARYPAEALRAACLEEFGEQAVTGRLKAVYAQVLAQ